MLLTDRKLSRPIDGVLLYDAEEAIAPPNGTFPAPRCELLDKATAEGIARLVSVFFRLRWVCRNGWRKLTVCIEPSRAYIPIIGSSDVFKITTAAELINLIPALNDWLAGWACAPNHLPCLTPPWATSRELYADAVQVISDEIRNHVAMADHRRLRIQDLNGHRAEINIPAEAQLRPIAPPRKDVTETAHITESQDVTTGTAAGGRKIIGRGVNGKLARFEAGAVMTIQRTHLRKETVRVYSSITPTPHNSGDSNEVTPNDE